MVPCREWKSICEYTGAKRLRLVKCWLGFRAVVEVERRVEFRASSRPGATTLRVEREWFAANPWDFLGRDFYSVDR